MSDLRIIHLADLHLGFPGPGHRTVADGPEAGRPLREVDIERAANWVRTTLVNETPAVDLVLIAGDLFHRANPLPRAVTAAAQLVQGLIAAGIDVVIIDGNHDTPSVVPNGSPTAFLSMFGAHVINGDRPELIHGTAWRNSRLHHRLAVHALPYGALRETELDGLQPIEGTVNILLAHGRVQGLPEPEGVRRSDSLPPEVLRRTWDYIALGDWHGHYHRPLAHVNAIYPGSLEPLNYGEASLHPGQADDKDAYAVRGAVDLRLNPEGRLNSRSLPYPEARLVLRLEPIDAQHLSAEELIHQIDLRTQHLPAGALAILDVFRCLTELHASLDHAAVRAFRQRTLRVDIHWQLLDMEVLQSTEAPETGALADQWRSYLQDHTDEGEEQHWLLEAGARRLEEARLDVTTAADDGGS